jgi:LacI family transcriptional regulator
MYYKIHPMGNNVDRDVVAKKAGVSSATVSRVFNHPGKVSPEKRDLVLSAAEELQYRPNLNASILARGINGKILLLDNNKLLKYDKSNSYYYSWLYVDLLNKIRSVLKNTVYELVISNFDDLSSKPSDSLKDYDGIICFDIDNYEDLDIIIKSKIPFVFGHHVKEIKLKNKFFTDNFYGGYIQARFLKDTGHEKAIYITGLLNDINSHRERYAGFREIYRNENIHLIEGALGRDGGAESAKKVIDLIKTKGYKAIAAVNDLTAVGIYFELLNSGIKIPADVSLIGYDNLPFTNLLPLRLSTIDINIGTLYKTAAEYLINKINNKKSEINESFKPMLVRGKTVINRK